MNRARLWGFAASLSLTAALAVMFAVTVPPAAGAASLLAGASRLARTALAGPAMVWGDDSKGELGHGGTAG